MCDVSSFLTAYGQISGGITDARNIKTQANFEAAQLEVMGTMAIVGARQETNDLRSAYTRQAQSNIAAMAVSGIAAGSFEAVLKGNREDYDKNAGRIMKAARREDAGNRIQADLIRANGRREASAKMWAGIAGAAETLIGAEQTYQEAHMEGDSRLKATLRSTGSDPEKIGKSWSSLTSFFAAG